MTGLPAGRCECGACDDLDEAEVQDSSDEDEDA